MPADDLILNVKQISGYAPAGQALASDAIVLQRGGLGGPYMMLDAASFVGTALAAPGSSMTIGGVLEVNTQAVMNILSVDQLTVDVVEAINQAAIDTLTVDVQATVNNLIAGSITVSGQGRVLTVADLVTMMVRTFNGRTGDILLSRSDIESAGGASLYSPRFQGCPSVPTAAWCDNSTRIANTAWVQRHTVQQISCLLRDHPFVYTFNGRTGDVTLTAQDIADAGEVFNDTALTGTPTAPTAPPGTDTTQLATTAFVQDAVSSSTLWAPINSPIFTGYPSGPTALPGSSTGQLATTAFVMNAVADSVAGVATFNGRAGNVVLTAADISGAGGAPINAPAFTGVPTAPTAAAGNSTAQLATTAFVAAAVSAAGGVASFNTRTGAIILTSADLSAAGGALLSSPTFTGTPAGPTAAPGTSTAQLATTAFVMAAIGTSVESFNGRVGVVTLSSADVSAAGGLINPSAVLTGVPTAPTAATATSTDQLATTAFVWAALATAGGVDSFNGRAGAVTLTAADVTGVGGALTSQLAAYLPLTGGSLTGPLNINAGTANTLTLASTGAGGLNFTLTAPAGALRQLVGTTAGSTRWVMAIGDSTPEAGSNAGSNFSIAGFSDAGASLGVWLSIARATGVPTFSPNPGTITLLQGLTASNALLVFNTRAAAQLATVGYSASLAGVALTSNLATPAYLVFQTNGILVANVPSAAKPGGGAWADSSDARIKTVMGAYALGLDEVLQLNPVVYTFKGNDTPSADVNASAVTPTPPRAPQSAPFLGSVHYLAAVAGTEFVGLVAQDVEPVFPGMVTQRDGFIDGEAVTDLRDINVSELTFALVNAVKTLAARVAALEAA